MKCEKPKRKLNSHAKTFYFYILPFSEFENFVYNSIYACITISTQLLSLSLCYGSFYNGKSTQTETESMHKLRIFAKKQRPNKKIYHCCCCNEIRIDYQCHTFHIIRFRTVIVRLLAYYYVIALP